LLLFEELRYCLSIVAVVVTTFQHVCHAVLLLSYLPHMIVIPPQRPVMAMPNPSTVLETFKVRGPEKPSDNSYYLTRITSIRPDASTLTRPLTATGQIGMLKPAWKQKIPLPHGPVGEFNHAKSLDVLSTRCLGRT
jgi:hypothetical protein